MSYLSHIANAASFARLTTSGTHHRSIDVTDKLVVIVDDPAWNQGSIDNPCSNAARIGDGKLTRDRPLTTF